MFLVSIFVANYVHMVLFCFLAMAIRWWPRRRLLPKVYVVVILLINKGIGWRSHRWWSWVALPDHFASHQQCLQPWAKCQRNPHKRRVWKTKQCTIFFFFSILFPPKVSFSSYASPPLLYVSFPTLWLCLHSLQKLWPFLLLLVVILLELYSLAPIAFGGLELIVLLLVAMQRLFRNCMSWCWYVACSWWYWVHVGYWSCNSDNKTKHQVVEVQCALLAHSFGVDYFNAWHTDVANNSKCTALLLWVREDGEGVNLSLTFTMCVPEHFIFMSFLVDSIGGLLF